MRIGKVSVVVWVVGFLVLQFGGTAGAVTPEQAARQVDERLATELKPGEGEGVELVDDATFLRRVSLDIVGDQPTPEALTAFVLDPASDKRRRAVARLLADPQFGVNWARYWRDVILARRTEDRALLVSNAVTVYLTQQFNEGAGWDAIATDFITARGDIREVGATAIIAAQDGQSEETTAEVSRIFLGIQLQCAQCHDHMTDRWKRSQFHELAAFFPRIGLQPVLSPTKRSLEVVVNDRSNLGSRRPNATRGKLEHFMSDLDNPAARGTKMQPVFFLTGQQLPFGTRDAERRTTIAEWMTSSPWFAKAYVNRIWAELVGEGFYEPIDDLGPDRTCTAPQTLDYLATQWAEAGYQPKWLMQAIMATEAYQRQSRPRRSPGATPFVANCQQRLRADQLYNALTRALNVDQLGGEGLSSRRMAADYRRGRNPREAFAQAFGFDPSDPRDEITGSIPQALVLMNAPQIQREVNARSTQTMLGRLLASTTDDEAVIVELYLRCLAREPRDSELATMREYVDEVDDRHEAFEDVLWVLINSTELLHRR